MEMARIENRMTGRMTGRMTAARSVRNRPRITLLRALAVAAVIASGAAAGCGRRLCPEGMRADAKKSKAGVSAFCQSSSDVSRAAWVQFYRKAEPRQVCPFVGGRPGGTYQAFHPDGARWLEGRYEGGLKVGRWTQWAPDGRKVADGEYRAGQLVEGAPVGFPATCETVAW
jgi:hypothetical protein